MSSSSNQILSNTRDTSTVVSARAGPPAPVAVQHGPPLISSMTTDVPTGSEFTPPPSQAHPAHKLSIDDLLKGIPEELLPPLTLIE